MNELIIGVHVEGIVRSWKAIGGKMIRRVEY